MKKYRRKAEEVEAVEVSMDNAKEIEEITGGHVCVTPEYARLTRGNFAVRDAKGNVTFCDREAFRFHFEEIEPEAHGKDASRKKILDGLREIKEVCKKNLACHECPIRNVCRLIDPVRTGDTPSNWEAEDIENAI